MFDCTVTFEGTGGIAECCDYMGKFKQLRCEELNVDAIPGVCGASSLLKVSGKIPVNDKTFKLLLKLLEMADREQANG